MKRDGEYIEPGQTFDATEAEMADHVFLKIAEPVKAGAVASAEKKEEAAPVEAKTEAKTEEKAPEEDEEVDTDDAEKKEEAGDNL